MRTVVFVSAVAVIGALAAVASAAEFKVYPGAKLETKATEEANKALADAGMDGNASIYTSADSYEKVCAFYKGIAKEWRMPAAEGEEGPKLRSGGTLKEIYFIFDGAADITTSKLWIKVQRPYFGRMRTNPPPNPQYGEDLYEDVRDVTAIVVSKAK